MAAWFAMLILLVTALLTAAAKIERPEWAAGFLVISSVVLSVLVMSAVFLMLTRFRPHLQDAKEYAVWLRDERKFRGASVRTLEVREVGPVPALPRGGPLRLDDGVETADMERRYAAEVSDVTGANLVVRALEKLGFDTSIYEDAEFEKDIKKQGAIWIGYRVPPAMAVPAIKASTKIWPQLVYLHISSDSSSDPPDHIHDELYIGGASKTAKEYGLIPWSKAEINALSLNVTTQEFHALVRTKYSVRSSDAD